MAINKLPTLALESNAITADLIASGAITAADISDGEITAAKLHTTLDFSAKTFTMANAHVTQAMVTQHQAALSVTESQVSDLQSYVLPNTSPTFTNTTLTGYLAGPATFTIDPAAVGDNTGTVVIAGDLQVDGTTTTINSTTLEVEDKNVVLGPNAANDAANNGAGLTVTQPDTSDATLIYDTTSTQWEFNKDLDVTGIVTATEINLDATGDIHSTVDTGYVGIAGGTNSNVGANALFYGGTHATLAGVTKFRSGSTGTVTILANGNVGIGTTSPEALLHVQQSNGGGSIQIGRDTGPNEYQYLNFGGNAAGDDAWQIGKKNNSSDTVGPAKGFYIYDLAASASRLVIDTNGYVGIGVTNPGYHIDARGGSSTGDGMRVKTGDNGYDGLIVSNSAILKCYPAAGQSVSLQAYNSGGSTKTGVKVTGSNTPAGEISTKLEFVTEMLGHNVYDNNDYGTSNDQYVDLEDWSPADFRILEIFGTANPNSGGSGAYADPVHMYVYCGSGWNGAELTYYVYGKSVAPLARDIYNSGSGSSANVAEVWWYNNTTTAQQDAATYGTASGYHLRLKFPNTNTTYGTQISLKVIKRA